MVRRSKKTSYGKKRNTKYNQKKYIQRVAQSVVRRNIEIKEKTYQYNAVGVSPISGSSQSYASIGYDASTVITQLGRGITQGTADDQRIGNRISVKGVYIDFYCTCASATEQNILRFSVVSPHGQYSNTSVSSLALQIYSNITTGSTECMQPIDTDTYKVYWNKVKYMKPYGTFDANYLNYYRFKKFIKFPKGKVLQWNQGNNQPSNDLFLVGISDSAIIANPGAISGFVKIFYTDA